MKRKTCKKLLWIGLIFVGISLISFFLELTIENHILKSLFGLLRYFGNIGIILLIIAWIFWNSEKRKERKDEIYKSQLEGLKKGKINVELKGKMRKLK